MECIDEVEADPCKLRGQSFVRKRANTLSCDLELALTCMGYSWASSSRDTALSRSSNSNLNNTAVYLSMTFFNRR